MIRERARMFCSKRASNRYRRARTLFRRRTVASEDGIRHRPSRPCDRLTLPMGEFWLCTVGKLRLHIPATRDESTRKGHPRLAETIGRSAGRVVVRFRSQIGSRLRCPADGAGELVDRKLSRLLDRDAWRRCSLRWLCRSCLAADKRRRGSKVPGG